LDSRKPYANTQLTSYIERRILELSPRKTQAEIAVEAGVVNPNMLSMVKTGASRLPLDRVPALAVALGVDPARLCLLAIDQWAGSAAARAFEAIFRTVVTDNEIQWIREIREASSNTDPAMTTRARALIRSHFGK
jgi:hypothetical protein